MFKRRNPLTTLQNIKNFLWPKNGYGRVFQYYTYRIKRLPGTPHAIASGFAYGAAVSFTPFVGFHIMLAIALSYIMGGSILAAAIGTIIGSPWTFPFIWMATYYVGNLFLNNHSAEIAENVDFNALFLSLKHDIINLNFEKLAVDTWPVLHPMLIGGFILFPVVWFVFYIPLRKMISIYQKNRGKRLAHRAEVLLKIHEAELERIAKIKLKQEEKTAKKEKKKIAKEQKKSQKLNNGLPNNLANDNNSEQNQEDEK